MNKKEIIVNNSKKIINLLQDYGFSFADANKMLRNKDVRVDGKVEKENVVVAEGQKIVFFYSDEMLQKKYEILLETDDVVVLYKYAGIETDGERGLENSLGLIAVHRLDRNTEGLMVFAKNKNSEEKLLKAFKEMKVHKFYLAEVVGKIDTDWKLFEAFLTKDSEKSLVSINKKRVPNSFLIKTKVKTIKSGNETSVVKVELLTGKTHQIRAHLAFLGHPIVGDGKYGREEDNKKFKQSRQKLACVSLKFDFVGIDSLNFKCFEKNPNWYKL